MILLDDKIDLQELKNSFFRDMMELTKPKKKSILDLFRFAKRIHPDVEDFYDKKLDIIWDFTKQNDLFPQNMSISLFGFLLYSLITDPEDKNELPEKIKNFAFEQFGDRKITMQKIDREYVIVFC